jgi:hypothetical protein
LRCRKDAAIKNGAVATAPFLLLEALPMRSMAAASFEQVIPRSLYFSQSLYQFCRLFRFRTIPRFAIRICFTLGLFSFLSREFC